MIALTLLVVAMQAISGVLWLAVALYLTPRIFRAWKTTTRQTARDSRDAFIAWLYAGFSLNAAAIVSFRATPAMAPLELATWGLLYALASLLAVWTFVGTLPAGRD